VLLPVKIRTIFINQTLLFVIVVFHLSFFLLLTMTMTMLRLRVVVLPTAPLISLGRECRCHIERDESIETNQWK
jgi:hypothetical protein